MESSRRAVEAYRRTRLIDGVTGDDDKVAPVYKLDEIGSVLQSSSYDVVHEMVDYIFKRLDHKSPLVKQKTLRLIKFEVGKAGAEFKREVQRQSAAIRQLFHYQGQPDPLRGDSLNKAVRETARETITALFASEEKSPSMEQLSKRIEGFGSTNFDARPFQEKKTLLGEVVDIGTASIKQGLNMLSNHYGQFSNNGSHKSSIGNYEAPNLRRAVSDRDNYRETYRESRETYRESRETYRDSYRGTYEEPSRGAYEAKTSYSQPASPRSDTTEERTDKSDGSQEEKLLESVTPPGGVRLQPSREAIQAFLLAAQKLNPHNLHHAFEQKLQAHSWQVRLKTLCFLEAVLRQRDMRPFAELAKLFEEDDASIVDCTESPQSTLRDKAKKVLSLLQPSSDEHCQSNGVKTAGAKTANKVEQVQMPDLIDTADYTPSSQSNGLDVLGALAEPSSGHDDLLGASSVSISEDSSEDPFAGMAVHASTAPSNDSLLNAHQGVSETANGTSSLFEGLSIADEPGPSAAGSTNLNDLLGSLQADAVTRATEVPESGKIGGSKPNPWQALASTVGQPPMFSNPPQQQQMMYVNPLLMSTGAPQVPGLFLQQMLAQAYPGMNPQQLQFQLQQLQQLQQQQQQRPAGGLSMPLAPQGSFGSGGLDGFDFSGNPYSATPVGIPKMEETTKAFDFISDHLTAARTVKK